jgi:hypothetical protein
MLKKSSRLIPEKVIYKCLNYFERIIYRNFIFLNQSILEIGLYTENINLILKIQGTTFVKPVNQSTEI